MTRRPLVVGTALALAPLMTRAQGPTLDSLQVGARVRLIAATGERTVASLIARHGDTLAVRRATPPETTLVTLDAVRRVEVSRDTREYKLLGGLAGYVAGAAVGAGVGSLVLENRMPVAGVGTAVGGMVGIVAGVVTGIVIGSHPVERWRRVQTRSTGS